METDIPKCDLCEGEGRLLDPHDCGSYIDCPNCIKKEACIYCHDVGYYRDDLSGGESYCTCPKGKALMVKEG